MKEKTMKINPEIQMRDPFVLPVAGEGKYYLFGTTDPDCWSAPGIGFDVYVSSDLEHWEGPRPAFRPGPGFWGKKNFWAPEAYAYRGAYYLFASFSAEGHKRGTQVLRADTPLGPYLPHSAGALTPSDWECLDGSLFLDEEGRPWMVFCHEWVQVRDGEVCAIPLSQDLEERAGEPILLFRGSEAPWTRPHKRKDGSVDPQARVTDGPFLRRMADGGLLMLWSSFSGAGYAIGQARSDSSKLTGPWRQAPLPLLDEDSGHGMVFESFEGRLFLSLHAPNATPQERPLFVPLVESLGWLAVDPAKNAPGAGRPGR
jgi:arabinan endo-1,5-alpha-L-arabinosidase